MPNDAFSIATWLKLPLAAGNLPNNIQAVFGNCAGGFARPGLQLSINHYQTSDGAVVLDLGDGTSGSEMGTPARAFPADGGWHQVTLTVDRAAGAVSIYEDGRIDDYENERHGISGAGLVAARRMCECSRGNEHRRVRGDVAK